VRLSKNRHKSITRALNPGANLLGLLTIGSHLANLTKIESLQKGGEPQLRWVIVFQAPIADERRSAKHQHPFNSKVTARHCEEDSSTVLIRPNLACQTC
jgi:hypothetical protein